MARSSKETGNAVPGFDLAFSRRLQSLISRIGTQEEAADQIGASVAQLISWKNGRTRPDFFALARLCEAAGEPVDWLARGGRPRDIQPETALPEVRTHREHQGDKFMQVVDPTKLDLGMVLLPRLNVEASAGQGVALTGEEIEGLIAFKVELLKEMGINPRNAHVLKIKGDSMFPTLKERDIIIIDASVIEALDEGLYTLVLGDVVRAKRLQPLANGGVRIISDNKAEGYSDEIILRSERESLRVVGRIRGVLRYFED